MSPRPHSSGQPLNIPLRPDWPRVGAWPGRFPMITPNLMTGGFDGGVRGDNPGIASGLNNVTVPATSFPFAGGPASAGPHRDAHRDKTATSLAVSVCITVGRSHLSAGPLEPLRLADVCSNEMRRANCWSARDGSSGLIGPITAGGADDPSPPIKEAQHPTKDDGADPFGSLQINTISASGGSGTG